MKISCKRVKLSERESGGGGGYKELEKEWGCKIKLRGQN